MEALRELMHMPRKLRTVAVVGARGHGKTALVRALAAASERRVETGREDAPAPTITSVVVHCAACADSRSERHLIQLIDTPGSLDSVMEIYAALALADGVLVVVDPAESIGLLVEKVVEQAASRRKKIMLVLNTGDAQPTVSPLWDDACAAVNNVISRACSDELEFDEWKIDPTRGNVLVGSALFGWGYRLSSDPKDTITGGLDETKLHGTEVDWTARMTVSEEDSWLDVPLDRSFGESVLDAIVRRMPSPVDASLFVPRDETNEDWVDAVRHCDPHGPLIVHVAQLIRQTRGSNELLAMGRVLSGTARAGQRVSVVTPLDSENTSRVVLPDTAEITSVQHVSGHELEIPAGNLCVLFGVGEHINKFGVVTSCEEPKRVQASRLFRRLARESTPPSVVRVTLVPPDRKHTPTLVKTLHHLLRADLASEIVSDLDEVTLAGISATHLQRNLSLLASTRLHEEIPYTITEPYAFFQETVTARSPKQIMAKSPNRHIRVFCTAELLSDSVVRNSLSREYGRGLSPALLTELQESSEQPAHRIFVDPSMGSGFNMLIGPPCAPPGWAEMEKHVSLGFELATRMGVLCYERVVGLRVDLADTTRSGWERHWRMAQTVMAMRCGVFASQLLSSPALLEAILAVEIVKRDAPVNVEDLSELLVSKRGHIVCVDNDQTRVRALVPTREIWGLEEDVKAVAGSGVVVEMILDHYERVEGDPLDPSTPAGTAVRDLRVRKGSDPEVLPFENLPVELLSRQDT